MMANSWMRLGKVVSYRRYWVTWLRRRDISGLLMVIDPGPEAITPPLSAVSSSKAWRNCSGTWSRLTTGKRAITLLLHDGNGDASPPACCSSSCLTPALQPWQWSQQQHDTHSLR